MGNRTAFQTDKAELSLTLLLRRESKRHKDTDMDNAYRQFASDGHTEPSQTAMELFGVSYNCQTDADVLRRPLQPA